MINTYCLKSLCFIIMNLKLSKFLFLLNIVWLSLFFFSCSKRKKDFNYSYNSDLVFNIDTVHIDFKETFPYLNYDMFFSTFSNHDKFLYNLNPQSGRLEEIDIVSKRIRKIIQLDSEGPNDFNFIFTSGLRKTLGDNFLFLDQYKVFFFDSLFNRCKVLDISKDNLKNSNLDINENFDPLGVFSVDGNYFYSLYRNIVLPDAPTLGVVKIDLNSGSIFKIPFNSLTDLSEFRFSLKDNGEVVRSIKDYYFITPFDSGFVISNSAVNEFWQYFNSSNDIFYNSYHSLLSSDSKTNFGNSFTNDPLYFDEISSKHFNDIYFSPFIYNEDKDLFIRLSKEFYEFHNGFKTYKIVISFFDKKLKFLSEEHCLVVKEGFSSTFSNNFFTFSNFIYIYFNNNDEMNFIKIEF